MKTLSDIAKNNKLNISVGALFKNSKKYTPINLIDLDANFIKFIIFESPIGEKMNKYAKDYEGINTHNIDKFLRKLFEKMELYSVNPFDSYTEKKNYKNDLKDQLLNENNYCVFYRTSNGVYKSLYCCLRNAIAHGNILFHKNSYVFYSVSGNGDKEEDLNIEFYMRVKSLDKVYLMKEYLFQFNEKNKRNV